MRVAVYFAAVGAIASFVAGCQRPVKRVVEDQVLTEPSGLTQITIVAKGIE